VVVDDILARFARTCSAYGLTQKCNVQYNNIIVTQLGKSHFLYMALSVCKIIPLFDPPLISQSPK